MRAAFLVLCLLPLSGPAFALRPYDSTDADVAKQGEFELELGPLGWRREGSKRTAVAPAVIGNFGLEGNRELVIQGQREVALDREPGEPRRAIVDNGVFIKQVLRQGTLQDASGPSVATEYGVLLPSVNGEKGTGLSVAGILSQRTEGYRCISMRRSRGRASTSLIFFWARSSKARIPGSCARSQKCSASRPPAARESPRGSSVRSGASGTVFRSMSASAGPTTETGPSGSCAWD